MANMRHTTGTKKVSSISTSRKSSTTKKTSKAAAKIPSTKSATPKKTAVLTRGKSDVSQLIEDVEMELGRQDAKEEERLDGLINEIEAVALSGEKGLAAAPPSEFVFVSGALRPDVTGLEGDWKARFTDSAQWCPATLCGAQLYADASGFAANVLGVNGEMHGFVGRSAKGSATTFLAECDRLEGYPSVCDRKEIIVTLTGNTEEVSPFDAAPSSCLRAWVYHRRSGWEKLSPVAPNDWAKVTSPCKVDQDQLPALARTSSGRVVQVASRGAEGTMVVAASQQDLEPLCRTASGRAQLGEAHTPQEEVCPHVEMLAVRYTPGKAEFAGINSCSNPKCGRAMFNWACLGCKQVFCSNSTPVTSHFAKSPECAKVGIEVNCVTLKPYCRICDRIIGDRDHPTEAQGPLRTALEAVHMAKYGHTNGMRDMVAELSATMEGINKTRAQCADTCDQWADMKERFSSALNKSLTNLAAAMGASGLAGHIDFGKSNYKPGAGLTPEQREAVLGGAPSLAAIAQRLQRGEFRKVVVLSGAGVSVSAGIPDFRSPGTGLYHNLAQYALPTPESIFDIAYFRENPDPFYCLAKDLYPGPFRPTLAHAMVALLERKGILLRNFTQNIDCLERLAGVTPARLVEAHGSFAGAACVECGAAQEPGVVRDSILQGRRPACEQCKGGVVKPRITFFGEDLPARYKDLHGRDLAEADLVLVMGTSLRVMPFATLPTRCRDACPRLLLNREEVGAFDFDHPDNYRDVFYQGDCDAGARELCRLAGWEEELDKIHGALQKRKMQTWEVDRYLTEFPPSVAEEAGRRIQCWQDQGEITSKQAEAARKAVEEQTPQVTMGYKTFIEGGDPETWEGTLRAAART